MAEALQLNEETVTSGRQLIARPASMYNDDPLLVSEEGSTPRGMMVRCDK